MEHSQKPEGSECVNAVICDIVSFTWKTDTLVYGKERIRQPWRLTLYEVIFEADTPAGKAFDVVLLWAIVLSIISVVLETVPAVSEEYGFYLYMFEWFVTVLFTIEYVLRIISAGKPMKYITSFYGIIDLLAILPTYISLVIVGSQYLLVIRGLRLLRVFRVLKLSRYLGEADTLKRALKHSSAKIIVFLGTVLTLVIIIGAIMYLIEGPKNGFTSIPTSMYWAIVTLTTVGYGDIAPQTVVGQILASFVMILGYAIIAVPTGIVSVELGKVDRESKPGKACVNCGLQEHADDAVYCKRCGEQLRVSA